MKVKNLHRLNGTRTWMWRTAESDSGDYYTMANGAGIIFMADSKRYRQKFCTCEKFKVCKTASGTRKKLNRLFAPLEQDPTEENPYRL